jgi:hypothetical protein
MPQQLKSGKPQPLVLKEMKADDPNKKPVQIQQLKSDQKAPDK